MKDFGKIVYLLRKIYLENEDRKWISDIIIYSKFNFENHWNKSMFPDSYNLIILLDPEVFTKRFNSLKNIEPIIKDDIQKLSKIVVDKIKIIPDYDKLEIINSEIRPIYTEWDEINKGQNSLIELLGRSSESLDFQNIGNTSRSILEKLANRVYINEKHKPSDPKIDINSGKYKNQLHSYIKTELSGDSNKELRLFAESAISTVEKAIDLANSLTHRLKAEKIYAEVCIIGTISAISIVKLINDKK